MQCCTTDTYQAAKRASRERICEVQVAKIPTFQVIILQGILGSTPWNALVFLTVYLQLIGFSDFDAALINSFFLAGAALGGVLGGVVGDWAARLSKDHGRIWACQFSVFTGIPFTLILLKGLPYKADPGTTALYAGVMFFFGLMHVWAAPACNNPVFAEIVPAHMRNLVYAFDRCGSCMRCTACSLASLIATLVRRFQTMLLQCCCIQLCQFGVPRIMCAALLCAGHLRERLRRLERRWWVSLQSVCSTFHRRPLSAARLASRRQAGHFVITQKQLHWATP
jgi:hypothetical protein